MRSILFNLGLLFLIVGGITLILMHWAMFYGKFQKVFVTTMYRFEVYAIADVIAGAILVSLNMPKKE
jgi:hypothetical protein